MVLAPGSWAWASQFEKTMKSRAKYDKGIQDFLLYHIRKGATDENMEANLLDYFDGLCEEKNENGEQRYASTTLRSLTSVFVKYWLHT